MVVLGGMLLLGCITWLSSIWRKSYPVATSPKQRRNYS